MWMGEQQQLKRLDKKRNFSIILKKEVYEFGENCDLVLHIYKDEDYNPDKDRDYCNIVTISTARDGKFVDDTDDVYVTDGSLVRELKRINEYRDFATK